MAVGVAVKTLGHANEGSGPGSGYPHHMALPFCALPEISTAAHEGFHACATLPMLCITGTASSSRLTDRFRDFIQLVAGGLTSCPNNEPFNGDP